MEYQSYNPERNKTVISGKQTMMFCFAMKQKKTYVQSHWQYDILGMRESFLLLNNVF